MKKNISIRKKQNSRGVAVIFTLGILGLLTVMALGFASTALLNRKIADNTSSADYARHIAKNIAFSRVKNAVLRNAISLSCYYSSEISGQPTDKDFLYKMDTFLDGVKLFCSTDSESSATYTSSAGTGLTAPVRWQYVYGADQNAASHKYPILGRYAYAVVPAVGLFDPSIHKGSSSNNRYGYSINEIPLPGNCNISSEQFTALGTNRWGSYFEIFKVLGSADSVKKDFFEKDGIGIRHPKSAEAFWIDFNSDGKKTPEEMFLRCNLPKDTAGWQALASEDGVKKLIGETDGTFKTLADAAADENSITFIPWLKNWTGYHDEWTADIMKKQIAANIIQYNLPGPDDSAPQKAISDQMEDKDWTINPPTYVGIGRHPMLNELGFAVIVAAELHVEEVYDGAELVDIRYTPKYFIKIENGAELINPFEVPTKDATVKFSGSVKIQINIFKSQTAIDEDTTLTPATTDFSPITETKDLDTSAADSDLVGWPGEEDFTLTLTFNSASWLSSPAYTKAGSFWRASAMKTVTLPTFSLPRELKTQDKSEYLRKLLKINKVTYAPKNVVLLYGGDSNSHQRDIAMLTPTGTFKYEDETSTEIWRPKDSTKVWVYQASFEAKDPLVNHYNSDWTFKNKKDGESSSVLETEEGNATSIKSINKKYPGTVFDDDGGQTDSDGCHRNSTLPEKLLGSPGNPLEVASDPAYTTSNRLSTSYIRHEPMRSLWEFGCISRAKAFETLNLSKAKTFTGLTDIANYQAGTFEDGDANILDQVKFSETDDEKAVYGKINLNSRCHNVFRQMFNTNVKWNTDLVTSARKSPYEESGGVITGGEADGDSENNSLVCRSASCPGGTACLAHLLMERSKILPFGNRSDLLVSEADIDKLPGYNSAEMGGLGTAQKNLRDYLLMIAGTRPSGLSLSTQSAGQQTQNMKWSREQFSARFMNLLSADPVDHVFIIVAAQSIKDIGGAPAFVDWNGDGEFDSSAEGVSLAAESKFMKTGYVRKKIDGSGFQIMDNKEKIPETISSTEVGSYDHGADKITGEAKMLVEMLKDPITGKWRIAGYRYVE